MVHLHHIDYAYINKSLDPHAIVTNPDGSTSVIPDNPGVTPPGGSPTTGSGGSITGPGGGITGPGDNPGDPGDGGGADPTKPPEEPEPPKPSIKAQSVKSAAPSRQPQESQMRSVRPQDATSAPIAAESSTNTPAPRGPRPGELQFDSNGSTQSGANMLSAVAPNNVVQTTLTTSNEKKQASARRKREDKNLGKERDKFRSIEAKRNTGKPLSAREEDVYRSLSNLAETGKRKKGKELEADLAERAEYVGTTTAKERAAAESLRKQTDYSASREAPAGKKTKKQKQKAPAESRFAPVQPTEPQVDADGVIIDDASEVGFDGYAIGEQVDEASVEGYKKETAEEYVQRKRSLRDKSVAGIVEELTTGNVPVKRDADGKIGARLKTEQDRMMAFMGGTIKDISILYSMVMVEILASKGAEGRWFGNRADSDVDATEYIDDEVIIESWARIRARMQAGIHPFAYDNPNLSIYGSRRFPGTAPAFVYNFIARSPNCNMTAVELKEWGDGQWINVVRPLMEVQAGKYQKTIIGDFMEAVESIDGRPIGTPGHQNLAGRFFDGDVSMSDLFSDTVEAVNFYLDVDDMKELNRATRRRIENAVTRQMKKSHKYKKGADGEMHWEPRKVAGKVEPAEQAILMATNAMKSLNVLSPILGMFAVIQKGISTPFSLAGARWANRARATRDGKVIPPFPKSIYYAIKNDPAAMYLWNELKQAYASGNRAEFYQMISELKAKGEAIQKLSIAEKWKMAMDSQGRLLGTLNTLTGAFGKFAGTVAEGGISFNSADLMIGMRTLWGSLHENGNVSISPAELEAKFAKDPAGAFMALAETDAMKDAVVTSLDNSMAATSVVTDTMQRTFHKLPGLEAFFFFATGTMFPKYAANMAGMFLPFTHTGNLFLARAAQKASDKTGGTGMYQDLTVSKIRRALILDVMQIGRGTALGVLLFSLYYFFGNMEEPDDEDKKYSSDELGFFGDKFGLGWMTHDINPLVEPFARSMAYYANTGDYETAEALFLDGAYTQAQSGYMGDLVNMTLALSGRGSWNEETGQVEDQDFSINDAILNVKETLLARGAGAITPPFIEGPYKDSTDWVRANSLIYVPGTTVADSQLMGVGSVDEQITREITEKNPVLAWYENVAHSYSDPNGGPVTVTGYTNTQQPIVQVRDAAQSYYYNSLQFDETRYVDGNPPYGDILDVTTRVRAIYGTYSSPEQMAANGIVIPFQARKYTLDDLRTQIDDIKAQWLLDQENDPAYIYTDDWNVHNKEVRQNIIDRKQSDGEKTQMLWDEYNKINSNVVPYSPDKYVIEDQLLYTRWEYPDGTAAQPEAEGSEMVYYNSGVDRDSTAIFQIIDESQNAFDAQTPVAWYREGITDASLINNSELANVTMQEAVDKGYISDFGLTQYDLTLPVSEYISNEQRNYQGDGSEASWITAPTVGQRGWVAVPRDYDSEPEYAYDPDNAWSANKDRPGKVDPYADDDSDDNSSSGWSYSGGGGGGGKYLPNIYSHAPYNINSDKPRGMYSKTPYSTRYDYLRPDLQTKGSRDAYTRQDI